MSELDKAVLELLKKINPWVIENEPEKWIGGESNG